MNELIEIKKTLINNESKESVSARELYFKLGSSKDHWIRWNKQNIQENEFFEENIDWIGFAMMANGNETKDYSITIEMAKHLAMMAKTTESHRIRNYFIECEKQLKSPITMPFSGYKYFTSNGSLFIVRPCNIKKVRI